MDTKQGRLFSRRFRVPKNYDSLIPDEYNVELFYSSQAVVDTINKIGRRSQAEHIFNSMGGVVNLQEYKFLKTYGTRNVFGTMGDDNLIKCVAYVGNTDQTIQGNLERELIESIGFEKVNRINSFQSRIRN